MDCSDDDSIDLTGGTTIKSHLLTVYILDKDTHRFMPICHIAQTGPDSISTSVIHTLLMSVRSEFGKYLRPKTIQIASKDFQACVNLIIAAQKVFQDPKIPVVRPNVSAC